MDWREILKTKTYPQYPYNPQYSSRGLKIKDFEPNEKHPQYSAKSRNIRAKKVSKNITDVKGNFTDFPQEPRKPEYSGTERGFTDITDITDKEQELKCISEKNQDKAFDLLDRLLRGGRTTTMDVWRQKCRAVGVGELDMWRARLEIEAMDLATFDGGTIKLKTG